MRLNLSESIKHTAIYNSAKIALHSDEAYTYKQLDRAINSVAISLDNKTAGSKYVILFINDKVLLTAALIGCIRANVVFALINPASIDDYKKAVDNSNGGVCVISDTQLPKHIYPNISIISVDKSIFDNTVDYNAVNAAGLLNEAAIIFTSGSSGPPKGVVRNHYSLLSEAIQWIVELKLTSDSRFLIGRPFFYTGGFVLMYATLFVGGTIITLSDNNALGLYQHAISKECDIAFLVPSQIHEMLHAPNQEWRKFCDVVLTMGSPIGYEAKQRFAHLFECRLIESWGNSEGLGTITSDTDINIRPQSIGRAFYCDNIIITDKNGSILKSNQIGYLAGYSDNQFNCYLGINNDSHISDLEKIIISEDIGYMDECGYFYILGRECEQIAINDSVIFPSNIEKVAAGHPIIEDCAVTVKKFDGTGAKLILLAVIDNEINQIMDIVSWVNSRLRDYEQIHEVVSVDSIPRNQGGKIIRDKIFEMVM